MANMTRYGYCGKCNVVYDWTAEDHGTHGQERGPFDAREVADRLVTDTHGTRLGRWFRRSLRQP